MTVKIISFLVLLWACEQEVETKDQVPTENYPQDWDLVTDWEGSVFQIEAMP